MKLTYSATQNGVNNHIGKINRLLKSNLSEKRVKKVKIVTEDDIRFA